MGEYISGGGQWKNPDPALLPEGQMMAAQLVDDLTALDGVQVLLAHDPSLTIPRPGLALWSDPDWSDAVAQCDAAWIVAPESDGILLRLTRMVEDSGRVLLGCRSDAVAIAASKIATAQVLAEAGIPVIPTPARCGEIPASATGWVAKPDDGAGSCNMLATTDLTRLQAWMAQGGRPHSHVVQPLLAGDAASVIFLAKDGQASVLSINSQEMRLGEECRYAGGVIGRYEIWRPILTPLVDAVAAVLPGLWGPVGLDVLLTETGPVIVEINPRLTTLWSGLHQALGRNTAEMVLGLAAGQALPVCRPHREVRVELS